MSEIRPGSKWLRHPGRLAVLGIGFALLLYSRRPSELLHAEFWGDDGWLWYPEAQTHPWASFAWPRAGYLQTIPRLGALLSQAFPLVWAPTIFALVALVMQVLPPVFLVSTRMAQAWPNAWARLGFALIMIGLPNSYEVFVKLTDTQWQLAVLAFLVIVSCPPTSRAGRIFDRAVLAVGGLSGPFCLMLLPVAAWQYWETRGRTALQRLAILLVASCAQVLCIALTVHSRSHAPLGAGLGVFARIVGLNILLAVFLGQQRLQGVLASPFWHSGDAVPLLVTGGGMLLIGFGLWVGGGLARKAWLFASLSFAAALIIPQVTVTGPQWEMMTYSGWGDRYYLFPMLAFIGTLFALAGARQRALRFAGGVALAFVIGGGVTGDWRYPKMPRTDFVSRARAFAQAPRGAIIKLPMHPTGTEMWLKKQ